MKQDTKEKLHKYNDIAQAILITLTWLFALIGFGAFSIYWIRNNAKNSNDNPVVQALPKRANDRQDYLEVFSSNYGESYYQDFTINFYYSANDVDPNVDYAILLNSSVYPDFDTINGDRVAFDYLIDFKTDVGQHYTLLQAYFPDIEPYNNYQSCSALAGQLLVHSPSSMSYILDSNDATYNKTFYSDNYVVGRVVNKFYLNSSGWWLYERYDNAFRDAVFNTIFSNENATSFIFEKDYNFNALVSETITGGSNLIQPYNLSYIGDPTDVLTYFYVKADFFSNNSFYRGIYFQFLKPYIIKYDGEEHIVNYYGSVSQLMVLNVYYMRSLPTNLDQYPSSSSLDLVATRHSIGQKSVDIGSGSNINAMVYENYYDFTNEVYRKVLIDNNDYNDIYDFEARPLPSDTSTALGGGLYNPYLYRGLSLYQVLNNGYLTYTYETLSYVSNDIGLGNVFDLYSTAFTGLVPILQIQVVPGVTIGLLVFAPFVVTLIIVILRLVKK